MPCSDRASVIQWLIVQRQMLCIWMEEVTAVQAQGDDDLISHLQAHERWLSDSISELLAA